MDISVEALEEAISIRRQIDALEKRLSAILEGAAPRPKERTAPTRKKGKLTYAGRKKLSQLMKARWAIRRKAAGGPSVGFTPAGRKKLSELMKARWAARRKAAADHGPGPGRRTFRRS